MCLKGIKCEITQLKVVLKTALTARKQESDFEKNVQRTRRFWTENPTDDTIRSIIEITQ